MSSTAPWERRGGEQDEATAERRDKELLRQREEEGGREGAE